MVVGFVLSIAFPVDDNGAIVGAVMLKRDSEPRVSWQLRAVEDLYLHLT